MRSGRSTKSISGEVLGLRLRVEGDPTHLIVTPQVVPDAASGLQRQYRVLMDAVPGGTGYLKTLYQGKDALGREGEGIMDILRRAQGTLETCRCRIAEASVGLRSPRYHR